MHPRLSLPTINYWGLPNKVAGDVGIEIELEGNNLPRLVPGWEVKRDNSLRGEGGRIIREEEGDKVDTPREYVTIGAVPITGVADHVHMLATRMADSTIRLSPRTSTHIHVNMQDATVREVIGYIILWSIIEPLLLRACGPERNGNLFCLPFSETYDLSTYQIQRWVAAVQSYNHGRYWPKRGKYACLNTDPLHTFGTVEARCFPASVSPRDVREWVMWCYNVKKVVSVWPDKTFESLLDTAYTDPSSIQSKIFGTYACTGSINTPAELIRAGVETGYEIWKAFSPLFNYDASEKTVKKRGAKTATAAQLAQMYGNDEQINFTAFELTEMPPPFFAVDGDSE